MKNSKYQPHPYIIYVKTPNYRGPAQFGNCKFNNYGFSSPEDTNINKSKKRVVFVGGSAVELGYGESQDNTLPGWTGIYLGSKYEVLNSGCCGYTTAEILIDFELRLLDFNPDYLVIYEMFNDVLYGGLQDGFRSDYSHVRKNDGLKGDSTCLTGRINKPIIPTKKIPNEAVKTYKRNLKSICAVAIANNIKPILVKYNYNPVIATSNRVYPLYEMGINDSREVFLDGLNRYSEVMKELSEENSCIKYLESESLIERDFIDSCHFKTSGMKKIGKSISELIKKMED